MSYFEWTNRPSFHLSNRLLLLFVLLGSGIVISLSGHPSVPDPSPSVQAFFNSRTRPLSFVPNRGQSDPDVRYQAQIPGGSLFFTDSGLKFAGTNGGFGLDFVGTSQETEVTIQAAQQSIVSYMFGSDPAKWQTGLPTYGQVAYQKLYPDISLSFQGQGSSLSAVFQLQPGADPAQIGWQFTGANASLDEYGALLLIPERAAGNTAVSFSPPQAWQEIDGQETAVLTNFEIDQNGQIQLNFGQYDQDYSLTIGTILKNESTTTIDWISDIAVGPNGNIYVTGATNSPLFPLANPYQSSTQGLDEVFVSVFTPDGQSLIFSTFLGGRDSEGAYSIAVSDTGRIYLAGGTASDDFPVVNALQPTLAGSGDGFLTVFEPDGQSLVFSTYLGGSIGDGIGAMLLAENGRIYLAGNTNSSDFPLLNPFQASQSGMVDNFVTIVAPDGQSLIYSTYLGGDSVDDIKGLALDEDGNIMVTGQTLSTNFPLFNPIKSTLTGPTDSYVTAFDPTGQSLIFSTYFGGSAGDGINGISVDENGRTYVVGITNSTDFPLVNPYQPNFGGGFYDAFVTVFNPGGQTLAYSSYLGGDNHDDAHAVIVDSGQFFITGSTNSTNFPVANPFQATPRGSYDIFVSVFSLDGQNLSYSTYLGGNNQDSPSAITLDDSGKIFTAGSTYSSDFPLANPYQSTAGMDSWSDGFITVFNPDGQSLHFSTYWRGDYPADPTSVGLASFGNDPQAVSKLLWLVGGLLLFFLVAVGMIVLRGAVYQKRNPNN